MTKRLVGMKMRKIGATTMALAMVATVAAVSAPVAADAQVNDVLRLQGRLLSKAGTPVPDGDYGMEVAFYKSKSDTKALFTYTAIGVKVKGGVFAVSVGEKQPLPLKHFHGGDAAWVGIKVGSDAELPRIALHKVPYALSAGWAKNLDCTGCVSAAELDPKVMKGIEDARTKALGPYAKSADLHKVATSGSYKDLGAKPTLVKLTSCPSGQFVRGYKADGSPICLADKDTKYSGKNFATSTQACKTNFVVAGIDGSGKVVCKLDQKGNVSGKDFALSNQACKSNYYVAGVDSSGKVVCKLDQKGNVSGKDFALSNQACKPGQHVAGISKTGTVVCATDKTHSLGTLDARYVNENQANSISGAMVKDSSLTGSDIANSSLTGSDIKDSSIGSADIANESLTGADIKNGSLTGSDIANGSITGSDIKGSTISGGHIANGSITGSDIKSSTISGGHIANESLTGADIKNGSIGRVDVNTNEIQRRVTGTCSGGKAIGGIKADGSVNCVDAAGGAPIAGKVASGIWYRVAQSNGGSVSGVFTLWDTTYHSKLKFRVSIVQGVGNDNAQTVNIVEHTRNTRVFNTIRVVERASNNAVYVEVRADRSANVWASIDENRNVHKFASGGWKLLGTKPSYPSGYTVREYATDYSATWGSTGNRIVIDHAGRLGLGGTPSYVLDVNRNWSGWQNRFTNSGRTIYMNHSSGSGMHINTNVNNTSGSYALEVRNKQQVLYYVRNDGHIYANGKHIRDANGGWTRTYGATGWYNGSYGGGMYMKDSTWVRTYGNKSLYVENGSLLVADGNGGIQLNRGTHPGQEMRSNKNGSPYIDFSNDSKVDYDARIQLNGNNGLNIDGADLHVRNGWIYGTKNHGLRWYDNSFGGSGDAAYIQYYSEGGENTKLRILNNNDADDDIELYQAGGARLTVRSGRVGINNTNPSYTLDVSGTTRLNGDVRGGASNGMTRFRTSSGYVEIGPGNSSHAHIQTDRSNFYFNKELRVNSGIIGSYDEDLYLRRAGTNRIRAHSSGGHLYGNWTADKLFSNGAVVAKGGSSCGSGDAIYGFDKNGNKLCRQLGGLTYIAWGRRSCPYGSTVYGGFMAGSHYGHGGSGSNYQCMPYHNQPLSTNSGNHNGSLIYGVEWETGLTGLGHTKGMHDKDASCAVCYVDHKSTVYMQPARTSCPSGYTRAYYGYLMSERHNHSGRGQYICVHITPQTHIYNSNTNHNGALLYHTEVECGSFPCKNGYSQNRELSCSVCVR